MIERATKGRIDMSGPYTKRVALAALTAALLANPSVVLALSDSTGQKAPSQPPVKAAKDRIEQLFSRLEKSDPTEEMFSEVGAIVERDPKNYRARILLGDCYDKVGLPDQAIEQFKLAIQYGPQDPEGMINLIFEQYNKGLKEEAKKILKEATRRFPGDARVQYWNGRFLLDENKGYLAEPFFVAALKKDPNLTVAYVDLADYRASQGRFYEASQLVDKDIAANPGSMSPKAAFIKGQSLFRLNHAQEALPLLRYAFEKGRMEPKRAGYYAFDCLLCRRYEDGLEPALFNLIASTDESGVDTGAQQLFLDIAKKIPTKKLNQSLGVLTTKLDQVKTFPLQRYVIGKILQRLGDIDMATMQFFASFSQDKTNADAAFMLARNLELYYHLYDKALYYYEQAHALEPNNETIGDYLERLRLRLPERQQDIAWRLKDWLRQARSPIQF